MKTWWRVTSRGRPGGEGVTESVLAATAEIAAVDFFRLGYGVVAPSLLVEVVAEDGTSGRPLEGAPVERYRATSRTVWSATKVEDPCSTS